MCYVQSTIGTYVPKITEKFQIYMCREFGQYKKLFSVKNDLGNCQNFAKSFPLGKSACRNEICREIPYHNFPEVPLQHPCYCTLHTLEKRGLKFPTKGHNFQGKGKIQPSPRNFGEKRDMGKEGKKFFWPIRMTKATMKVINGLNWGRKEREKFCWSLQLFCRSRKDKEVLLLPRGKIDAKAINLGN